MQYIPIFYICIYIYIYMKIVVYSVVYSLVTMFIKIPFQEIFRNPLLSLPGTFRDSVFFLDWFPFGGESDQESRQRKVKVGGPVCGASRAGWLGPWAIAHQTQLFSFSLPDTLPGSFRTAGRLFLRK